MRWGFGYELDKQQTATNQETSQAPEEQGAVLSLFFKCKKSFAQDHQVHSY